MQNSAKGRYEKLRAEREPFLWRARRNALLTIPSLMPLEGQGAHSHAYEPYQSVGAEGVSHLSSRLLIALLPPGRNFFRLDLPEDTLAQVADNEQVRGQLDEWRLRLASWEAAGQAVVDRSNWRVMTDAGLQQLINAGNILEYMLPDSNLKLYRLDQYVVRRDYFGNIQEIIIEEKTSRASLPDYARKALPAQAPTTLDGDDDVSLWTWIQLAPNGKKYTVHQEVEDTKIGETEDTFTPEELPYNALMWKHTPGECYGRSMIEEHGGDLRSLDMLEKALLEGASLASLNRIMIKPMATGGALKNRLARSRNGDVLIGDFDQVKMMSFENAPGMQVTASYAERIEARLRWAFLLNMAVQRNAERVTATEINTLIEEIENALGGVYSVLSHSLMEWRLNHMITNLQREGTLPDWEDGDLIPRVLTGLEALSRDRDVQRVRVAAEIIQLFGPEATKALDVGALLRQAFIGLGLTDVTLSRKEVEANEQKAAAQQAAMDGMGQAIPQAAKAMMEGQK